MTEQLDQTMETEASPPTGGGDDGDKASPVGEAAGLTPGSPRRPGGRKPKACFECKKLKMKCEIFPGDRKCRHCLRRKVDCISMRRAYTGLQPGSVEMETYGKKLEAVREEMQLMRQSLDSILSGKIAYRPESSNSDSVMMAPEAQVERHGAADAAAGASSSPLLLHEERQAARTLLTVNQMQHPVVQSATAQIGNNTTSPAGLSTSTHMAMTRDNSVEPPLSGDQGNGPVALEDPMGSLYEVTRLRNIRSNKANNNTRCQPENQNEVNDFISRGVIPESEAQELYDIFHRSLNHYLWVGLEQTHSSFDSVRRSSELLAATILTVTALHIPTSATTFDACYKEFLSLIMSSMFERYHCVDDVRGLCIAAFWLSEVSWKLSGHAIRIATELNIHQSFTRALAGDQEHFQRARLWYMLYVCDHHFSIAYGRPPMIAESLQIREHELFLQSPYADPLDARILSQVNLMQILTRVYNRFSERRPLAETPTTTTSTSSSAASMPEERGVIRLDLLDGTELAASRRSSNSPAIHSVSSSSNIPRPSLAARTTSSLGGDPSAAVLLTNTDLEALRGFNIEIDSWHMRWYARQTNNYFIGTFPPKGIILYSYFAKLQLNSLAVRGITLSSPVPGSLSTERKGFANMAISAATSILTFVLEEDDMRRALVGTPLYVHTMIAFASVFLMKVVTRWNRVMGLNIEQGYVSRLLGRMIGVLKSTVTSDRHVLRHIAAGLEKMLEKIDKVRADSERHHHFGIAREPLSQIHRGHVTGFDGGGLVSISYEGGGQAERCDDDVSSMFPPTLGLLSGASGGGGGGDTQLPTPATWDSGMAASYRPSTDLFGDGLTDMNDSLMYEAFGTGSAADVYNLLSSQFSF